MKERIHLLLVSFLILFSGSTQAVKIPEIIVNKGNTETTLSRFELIDIYTKKTTKWKNGDVIVIVQYPENSLEYLYFINTVLRLTDFRYKTTLRENLFAGSTKQPPTVVFSKSEMIVFIENNFQAIGYIFYDGNQNNSKIKILLVR